MRVQIIPSKKNKYLKFKYLWFIIKLTYFDDESEHSEKLLSEFESDIVQAPKAKIPKKE